MDKIWPWITSLPSSSNWPLSDSFLSIPLATSTTKSILLNAERTAGSDIETLVTFSISLHGFHNSPTPSKTLWISNPFPLSSPSTHLLFLLQLLNEVISLSPSHSILPAKVTAPNLNMHAISIALDSTTHSLSNFFTLTLICRLFWLCAVDAPAEAGFLFFNAIDKSSVEHALDCKNGLQAFLVAIGADLEPRFMRSLGYMIAKWCILRDLPGVAPTKLPAGFCPSYVANCHGLWILKGYAPISAMCKLNDSAAKLETRDSVLKYALAHQQLEAVVQMEYAVSFQDPRFIKVSVNIDNIRLHVVRLGFGRKDESQDLEVSEMEEERHFPSRVRIWVGPELGSGYAMGLSLGRSTDNVEKELAVTRTMKGNFDNLKTPSMKAKSKTSVRSKGKSWRWEQEAEGNAGIFEGVLCDGGNGEEVVGGVGGGGMRRRYRGTGRPFSKSGGLVVAGDELGEGVSWRVGREMEGRVLKWRVGGRIWVSYFPNEVKSGYWENRGVEWEEEVDLALGDGY